MKVRVLFFAKGREVAGTSEVEVDIAEGADTSVLMEEVVRRFPGITSVMGTMVLALNMDYLPQGEVVKLKEGDEVALIPPISGG